jgi:hypothetical protein
MAGAELVAIAFRIVAIAAVVGAIVARIKSLRRASKKNRDSQTPGNPPIPPTR